jgi:hypothetical protein
MEFELFFKALSSAPAEKIGLTIRFIFVLIEDVHLGLLRRAQHKPLDAH